MSEQAMAKKSRYWGSIVLGAVIVLVSGATTWVALFDKAAPSYQLSFMFHRPDGMTTVNVDCENLHYSIRQTYHKQDNASEAVQQLSMLVCSDIYALLQQVPKQLASPYSGEHRSEKLIRWTQGDNEWQWRWQDKYDPSLRPVFTQLDDLMRRMPDSALAGGANINPQFR
ncbi:hypothetical protein F9L16_22960 [Agarivorans sp. B2Z047]|uniref:Uncharacterized protein n=1 Tax=Agarivorans albus MKT 106 TaxID=1331007 RepID=R9PRV8_AGAAL|nr:MULTISPECIES: hypothetical protein [Agarivorans]MPW31831.1 hypothetical protein [Agarivorans sp. B2Z047]UQN41930.1 hypothetical protein LQZ07_19450 [Agarivorans sp. B2Z047]GAD04132.1 hypothetical protein AALB_4212 [Agarivorans albus MKT 106]